MTSPYVLENLRNELKSKEKELSAKSKEVELERAAREASERANESKIVHIDELENRILENEARCNELKHECKTLKNDRRALEASLAKTSAEADRWVVGLVPRSPLAPTLSLALRASQAERGARPVQGWIGPRQVGIGLELDDSLFIRGLPPRSLALRASFLRRSSSSSDAVRLHDRISQYRREVESLKKENETLNTVIQAKDRAIEESEAVVAEAVEANASKRKDLNVILDLQRQLKELEERLGGEESQNKLADSENEAYRKTVEGKDDEIETLLRQIESQRGEVLEAMKVRAAADVLMAEAKAKMAESVEMTERARRAEAARVGSGGLVPMDVHETALADLSACREVIDEYEKGSRDGAVQALRAARATADARTAAATAQALKAKVHLAKALGEYDYTLLFNEHPPSEARLDDAEARAEEAARDEGLSSFEAVATEKERALEAAHAARRQADQAVKAKEAKEAELQTLRAEGEALRAEVVELRRVRRDDERSEREGQGQGQGEGEGGAAREVQREVEALRAEVVELRRARTAGEAAAPPPPAANGIETRSRHAAGTPGDVATSSEPPNASGDPATATTTTPHTTTKPVVSREALASIVNSLVAAKQSKIMALYDDPEAQGASHSNANNDDEEDLYRDAIAMLQEELAKLTDQMMSETDVAARIRQQVGDWKTAQLSAKQTAELLDSYNQMSMKLAAQTAVMTQRQEAYDRAQQTERSLVNQIADLHMEIRRIKAKSPLRSVKKALSSTVKGVKSTFSSPAPKAVTTISPMGDEIGRAHV